jgi:hypothetical protein
MYDIVEPNFYNRVDLVGLLGESSGIFIESSDE